MHSADRVMVSGKKPDSSETTRFRVLKLFTTKVVCCKNE